MISVIVPVYNVEKYLRRCVDSILAQTFPDFELILVDDGSTDASGGICDKYAERDKRVRVVHTENQGVAAARNRGLEENRSEYITFVDSDDWVTREYLETLHRLAETYQADLVISCGINEVEGRRAERAVFEEGREEQISRAEAYKRMFVSENNVSFVTWAKLYRKTLFQSVRYPVGEIYEDSRVIDQIVERCEKIVFTPYQGYHYFRRRGSIVHGRFTPGHMSAIRNAKHLWDFVRERYPEVEDAGKVHYLRSCFNVLNLTLIDPDCRTESKRLRKEILKESSFFFSCHWFGLVEKMAVISLAPGLFWYKLLWKFYLRISGKLSGTVVS